MLGNCFIVGFIYNSYISVKNIIMCIYIYIHCFGDRMGMTVVGDDLIDGV